MTVAVAMAPGNVSVAEARAAHIWQLFAAPQAPHSSAYARVRGQPLLVVYAVRQDFDAMAASTGPGRSHFHLAWSSGEDSNASKVRRKTRRW